MVELFIDDLKKYIDIERNENQKEMKNEIYHMDTKQRELKGKAVNNITGKCINKNSRGYVYKFRTIKKLKTEIDEDDVVLVFPQNAYDNHTEGTIIEKKSHSLSISFEYKDYYKKIPKWLNEEVMIHLSINNTTYNRMEKNLDNLTDEGVYALKLALNREKPKEYKLKNITFKDKELNKNQKNAITNAISCNDFYLIHGPFGTGKTKTLVELIIQEVQLSHKVLVSAESNAAVDNIAERISGQEIIISRLGKKNNISNKLSEISFYNQIKEHELQNEIKEKESYITKLKENQEKFIEPTYVILKQVSEEDILTAAKQKERVLELTNEETSSMAEWIKIKRQINHLYGCIHEIKNKIEIDIIKKSQVIFSTNSSAALDVIKNISFDVVIIDEASQATIPSVLIPISKGKRFILAGDHKQLPPTVLNNDIKDEFEKTLFELLIEKFQYQSSLLDVQYRMNKILMELPNNLFYDSKLQCAKNVENNMLTVVCKKYDKNFPLIFINTANNSNNKESKKQKSYENQLESEIILKIIKEYQYKGFNNDNIGVITPYDAQVNLIQSKTDVSVKTVDGFQGNEKEIILISTVRSNNMGKLGFLTDYRRLNVSLTRAKKKLIIVGNANTLNKDSKYSKLIKYCVNYNSLITL